MNFADHIMALVLLLIAGVYPVATAATTRGRLEALANAPSEVGKIRLYWQALALLWGLATLVLGLWLIRGHPFAALGLTVPSPSRFWTAMGVVAIIALIYMRYWHRLGSSPEIRQAVIEDLEQTGIKALIPTTPREGKYWIVCSISASAEELVYRGFFLWYLSRHVGLVAACIIVTVVFALAHTYQGIRGVLKTGMVGLVLLLLYFYADSLWPAMVLHVVQDLFGGFAGYRSLVGEGRAPAAARP